MPFVFLLILFLFLILFFLLIPLVFFILFTLLFYMLRFLLIMSRPVTLLRVRSSLSLDLRWIRAERWPPVFLVLFVLVLFTAYWLTISWSIRSIFWNHSLVLHIFSFLLPLLHILSSRFCIFPPFIPICSLVVIWFWSYHAIPMIFDVSACLHQLIFFLPLILFSDHFLLRLIRLPVPRHQFWHALRKVHLDSPIVNQYIVHLQVGLLACHWCFELDKSIL